MRRRPTARVLGPQTFSSGWLGLSVAAAAGLTMRRIDWIRVVVIPGTVRCEAHGVGHRLPAVRPIGLRAARLLAEEGVPVVVCRDP